MNVSHRLFILHITIFSLNLYSSNQNNTDLMRRFNLSMMINLPMLCRLHTYSTPNSQLHVTYHLTNSDYATYAAIRAHLFSAHQKQDFFAKYRTARPNITNEELEELFQTKRSRALEQATDPQNFATIEPHARQTLTFKFINKQTIETSLALIRADAPFRREIRLFDTHEFSPEIPTVTFNAQEKTITQTFNIQHKDAPQKPQHAASWLYINQHTQK